MIDVKNIAKLARLELTPKEKAKYTGELSSILEYVEKLKEVDTRNIEPIAQVTGLKNVMRDDEVLDEVSKKSRRQILENAPERDGDFIKMKSVF